MSYTIITVTVKAAHFTTDFEKASEELSKLVTDAINRGWKPQGGVAVGLTQATHQPFMFQAMVKN
jgi:Domain of unknown function (DUF1737)